MLLISRSSVVSLTKMVNEEILMHGFLDSLGIEKVDCVVFCDSQSGIHMIFLLKGPHILMRATSSLGYT